MTQPFAEDYDVVFLGGGLASSMTARYLKRRHSGLAILVLEKNTRTHWNPGESTVGVAGIFMIRDLGLSTYAYVHHLPKNALRYFFHESDEPFDVTTCSEIGCNMLPVFPTFQVDRARLDADLWKLNQALGIVTATGSPVDHVRMGTDGEAHEVRFERDGQTHSVRTRWVVHGAGRNPKIAPIFDELSPVRPDTDHPTAAAWGRFRNVGDIDLLGDDAWRRRVGYTSRYLSTNHFMGQGYWIWAIPIGHDVVSWGVVYDKQIVRRNLGDRDAFLEFLRQRDFPRALLADAELLDFQSHAHLPFRRESFCSADGWAVVGDAWAFTDPFYSPASDNIARHAYLLEHLVTERDPERLRHTVRTVNAYCELQLEQQRLLYVGQYGGFGSYELFNIKSLWDFYAYTNLLVRSFYERRHADLDWLAEQVESGPSTTALMRAVQRGFADLYVYLRDSGNLERRNRGAYSLRQNRFRIEEEMLLGQSDDDARRHMYVSRIAISETLEARFGLRGLLRNRLAQELLSVREMSRFELSGAWLESFLGKVSRRFEELLREQSGEELQVEITADCFGRPLPFALEDAHPLVASRAAEIWQRPAVNPVWSSLL